MAFISPPSLRLEVGVFCRIFKINTPEITTTAGETDPATTTGVVSEDDSDIPAIVSGDVNNDSFVDMKDVLALRKFLAGMNVQINVLNADANEDGSTDMKDVLTIRKRLAHLL